MGPRLESIIDFDIDRYLNPWIPSNRLSRLPKPVSRFLGYRDKTYKEPPHLITCLWTFIGVTAGLLTVGALYRYSPDLNKYNPPVIIASLGASAILDYNAIRGPLAQPRNAFFGQTFSAIIGVAISKGFQRYSNFQDLQWIAGPICCAVASFVMSMTNTVHPPGGATAVLAATNTPIINMGWMFVPFIMMSSVVMLAVALLVNNIQRSYPVYWWTPKELRPNKGAHLEKVVSNADSHETLRTGSATTRVGSDDMETIVVTAQHVHWPDSLWLSQEERAMLQSLQGRMLSERLSFSEPGRHV